MPKYKCTMCKEELELSGNAVIKLIRKPYHEREEVINNAYINSRLCGPMVKLLNRDGDA